MNNVVQKMRDRIERTRDESDFSYFNELVLLGELILKLTTSYLVAGLSNGILRGRYRAEYKIMHSSGLGVWAEVLDEILTGTLSTHITQECSLYSVEFTKKTEDFTSWQYEACACIENVCKVLEINIDIPAKKSLRFWYRNLVLLRNKKAHGAYTPSVISSAVEKLEHSLTLIIDNLSLLKTDAAYMHLNSSKKYRISKISSICSKFDFIKNKKQEKRIFSDGAYIFYDKPRRINLFFTDQDLSDVFFPNGKVKYSCELLSYITGKKKEQLLDDYNTPPDDLPQSETYGLTELDVQGNFFGNIPIVNNLYIKREMLENEIKELLFDSRHPVITLAGRGGIGKTSTIISILHSVSVLSNANFEVALWFSARDIDLHESGPKPVKMAVSTQEDICNQYIKLMAPETIIKSKKDKFDFFIKELQVPYEGKGKLLTFDNFETLNEPEEIFHWLNTHVRLPNKIVITTRIRSFKGDYPVDVKGMSKEESFELIKAHAGCLGIVHIIDQQYMNDLFEWSEGHPYIIKVLLGQLANKKNKIDITRMFSGNEDILNALFERTYSILTPTAIRVYLTICKWNSDIPEVALKAVLARPTRAIADIVEAIDELINYSMIEVFEVDDGRRVLTCPIASRFFGEKKLKVFSEQFEINQDVEILRTLGASQHIGMYSFGTKITSMLKAVISFFESEKLNRDDMVGIISYLAQGYPNALCIAGDQLKRREPKLASDLYNKFIEISPDTLGDSISSAWEGIAICSEVLGNGVAFIHAKAMLAIRCIDDNFESASLNVNMINKYINENPDKFTDHQENKIAILMHLADKMLEKLDAYDNADDCSRIAWLLLHCGQQTKAGEVVSKGLELMPTNAHCLKLQARLNGVY